MKNIKTFNNLINENMDSMEYQLEILKGAGIVIEDNRKVDMGFSIRNQNFEFVKIVADDRFGISTSGLRIFKEEIINKYKNEFESVSGIVKKLNDKIDEGY